ncbi:MAG: exodeoxyribonuclease VII small subunit [Odoribacteraceae bacterium]|jgi:exodeoxyribonuclease VII small subunit|nr:exodeoxyribonuclease VII small subunit [Odoribacteraceae bacterium]
MEALKYREAVEEIERIIAKLEENKLDVDELGEQVKRVAGLVAFCKATLRETEEEVENILRSMEEEQ